MESQTADAGWEWPEYDGDMDLEERALKDPVPEEEPPIPLVPCKSHLHTNGVLYASVPINVSDSSLGEELQELQIVKEKRLCELSREIHQGHYYASLPNSEIDWSLEGRNVCRIVRCPFYGHVFEPACCLRVHLHNATHRVSTCHQVKFLSNIFLATGCMVPV